MELIDALQHDPHHQGPAGQAQQAAQQALQGAGGGVLPGMLHVIHIVFDLQQHGKEAAGKQPLC